MKILNEIKKHAKLVLNIDCVSTKRQLENGTLMFHDPVLDQTYGLYKTGYVRKMNLTSSRFYPVGFEIMNPINRRITKRMRGYTCYVLETYPNDYKSMWFQLERHIAKARKRANL